MRMGAKNFTRRSMAAGSSFTPVFDYTSFQPQYAPAAESTTPIAACTAKLSLSGQIQQLVDAGLITLDGESDEEPEFLPITMMMADT